MALSYALSLNLYLASSVQTQCMLENSIVSVERLEQYMHIPSEAPEVIESNRPPPNWPYIGKVDIQDLRPIDSSDFPSFAYTPLSLDCWPQCPAEIS